ncbi:hypothetical protein OTU49_015695 [Cherax quadricarinatus]|uniref:Uncharacterized protein n=1 Tax=Cherax quadricarinatus TaxID=27406 RepID=A0AAW0XXK7_CHEQU
MAWAAAAAPPTRPPAAAAPEPSPPPPLTSTMAPPPAWPGPAPPLHSCSPRLAIPAPARLTLLNCAVVQELPGSLSTAHYSLTLVYFFSSLLNFPQLTSFIQNHSFTSSQDLVTLVVI